MRSAWTQRWFIWACVFYTTRCTNVQDNPSSKTTPTSQHTRKTLSVSLPPGEKDLASADSPPEMASMSTHADSSESAIFNRSRSDELHCGLPYCLYERQKATCRWDEPSPPSSSRPVSCLRAVLEHVRELDVMDGRLPHLTRHVLDRLSNKNIRDMHLTSNDISRLDPDTFADFPHLKLLDLSGNTIPPDQLHTGLKSITSPTFRTLRLNSMSLTTLPDWFFDMFTNRSLEELSLLNNRLHLINNAVFAPFQKVSVLDMSDNGMQLVRISTRVNVEKLILEKNRFGVFPDLCFYQTPETVTSAFKGLLSLSVSGPLKNVTTHRLSGACFPDLQRLRVSTLGDSAVTLPSNFVADLPNLEHLSLKEVSKQTLYEPFLFNSSSLKTLTLTRNGELGTTDAEDMFQNCPRLQELFIIQNPLWMSERQMWQVLGHLKSLTTLHLEKVINVQMSLPANLTSMFPRLQKLFIIDVPMEIPDNRRSQRLLPLTSLTTLHLEKIQTVYKLLDYFLARLPNLQELFIIDTPFIWSHWERPDIPITPRSLKSMYVENLGRQLVLPDNMPSKYPSLQKLYLIDTPVEVAEGKRSLITMDSLTVLCLRNISAQFLRPNNLRWRLPNLKELYVIDMPLEMSEREVRQVAVKLFLVSLITLHLENVGRQFTVPENVLRMSPKLKKLVLVGNSMDPARLRRALQNVTSVQHLDVRNNVLDVVTETTLPWSSRQRLTYLDVSHNPFNCSCDLLWFHRWLGNVSRNNSVWVVGYTSRDRYLCHSPPSRKRLPLLHLNLTEQDCAAATNLDLNLELVLAVSGSSLLVLVSLTVGLVYRYRWHLRLWLYRCRRHRQRAAAPVPYELDVYLAYSSEDVDWLCETLVPLLEEDHGLKTFLRDRDTRPGSVITDVITRYMDQSARILLLISDHYTRDQWRLFEFEHIVYSAVDQQKDVIVVLLGDVEAGRLPRDMRRMLTRGTFLQWGPGEEARAAFTQGLAVALKTQDIGVLDTYC